MPMVSLWQKPPISLLLACFALASATSPVQTSSLEAPLIQSDFNSTIGTGVWFVEYYSPYCGHCRAFAPIWEKLVVSDPVADVQYARVDCSVSGALCDANGVTGYPQLNLYRDGQFVDKYKGGHGHGLDLLTEYLAQSVGAPTTKLVHPGEDVFNLSPDELNALVAVGPVFLKFCTSESNCVAETWTKLAPVMKGRVTVAQLRCDEHHLLCSNLGITKPMMVYFPLGGVDPVTYTGLDMLSELAAFAELGHMPEPAVERYATAAFIYVTDHPLKMLYLLALLLAFICVTVCRYVGDEPERFTHGHGADKAESAV